MSDFTARRQGLLVFDLIFNILFIPMMIWYKQSIALTMLLIVSHWMLFFCGSHQMQS